MTMRKLLVLVPWLASPALAAPPAPAATEIKPVELAGPFRSLAASCRAAPPCGFTDMDAEGNERAPAKQPNCDYVLEPANDMIGHVPAAVAARSADGATAMTHKIGGNEIRLGGVRCAVPQGLRREHAEYYVFVHRKDGWWRTARPMFEYDYNDKYCGGALYVRWNDTPSRTIAGLLVEDGCLTCGKQAQETSIAELMLRVELTGGKPAVFPFLPVGQRAAVELLLDPPDQADCKASKSARSLQESWPADNEVVLTGKPGHAALGGSGLTLDAVAGDGGVTPGRYRFTRP